MSPYLLIAALVLMFVLRRRRTPVVNPPSENGWPADHWSTGTEVIRKAAR